MESTSLKAGIASDWAKPEAVCSTSIQKKRRALVFIATDDRSCWREVHPIARTAFGNPRARPFAPFNHRGRRRGAAFCVALRRQGSRGAARAQRERDRPPCARYG